MNGRDALRQAVRQYVAPMVQRGAQRVGPGLRHGFTTFGRLGGITGMIAVAGIYTKLMQAVDDFNDARHHEPRRHYRPAH